MNVADLFLTAFEKTLLKTPTVYRCTKLMPRNFFSNNWNKKLEPCGYFLSKRPVRRMVIVLATNQAYLGTNCTDSFHYQKFNMKKKICLQK